MGIKSIRAFIGSKNFNVSKSFYKEIGFEELPLSEKMSYFRKGEFGFYLQDYYEKNWIDNSMIFLEVEDLKGVLKELQAKNLTSAYPPVKLSGIHKNDWGSEFFLHDPSGILWHIGTFN